jgi:hypothetical protein
METRRFTLTISDSEGHPRRGEVVLAQRWQPQWDRSGPETGCAFLIVLLREPGPSLPQVSSPGVAVCLPERPLAAPATLREPAPSYTVDGRRPPEQAEEEFPSFSNAELSSYARGRIVAATPLGVRSEQVFTLRHAGPRLALLAKALVEGPQESTPERRRSWEPFLGVLASSLAAPDRPGVEAADPAAALAKLRNLVAKAESALGACPPEASGSARRAIERLLTLAGDDGEEPLAAVETLFGEPLALAEEVFFCRCLAQDVDPALELATMRTYLAAAVVPVAAAELAMDRAVTLEQLSSAVLFMEPHRLEGMRATFEYFRKRFGAAYQEHHRRYWQACEQLLKERDEAEGTARALARLNRIRELGKAVGVNALAQYDDLGKAPERCLLVETLADSLTQQSSCPLCGVTLADEAPAERVRDVVRRLQRALRQQQNRLSSQAIRQILSQQGGERIERFLKVVQASDLRGLAEVLDDELVEFLRALLTPPPGAPLSPLERLRQAYPVVSEESLAAAVEEFRQLLEEALAAEKRAGRRARVSLDAAEAPVSEE